MEREAYCAVPRRDTRGGLARCDSLPHTIKLPALSPASLPKGATLFEWEEACRYHPVSSAGRDCIIILLCDPDIWQAPRNA